MKQYSYAELKAEVESLKKEKSDILGLCCNCGIEIKKSDLHHTHFAPNNTAHCCVQCDPYTDELLIFLCLLACMQGTKSWDIFRKLKDE